VIVRSELISVAARKWIRARERRKAPGHRVRRPISVTIRRRLGQGPMSRLCPIQGPLLPRARGNGHPRIERRLGTSFGRRRHGYSHIGTPLSPTTAIDRTGDRPTEGRGRRRGPDVGEAVTAIPTLRGAIPSPGYRFTATYLISRYSSRAGTWPGSWRSLTPVSRFQGRSRGCRSIVSRPVARTRGAVRQRCSSTSGSRRGGGAKRRGRRAPRLLRLARRRARGRRETCRGVADAQL